MAMKVLGMLKQKIVHKELNIVVRLHKMLVGQHLEYCSSVQSPSYIKDTVLLERVKWHFTKMIPAISELPYEENSTRLQLWSLKEHHNRGDLTKVFKMIIGISSVPVSDFFDFDASH
jgi:hypothetical protein